MDRKLKILYAIINSYIVNGEPVGSRTLSKNLGINASSATIRNDMSDLEDMGLLEKTHISSGRIPSEKAYRFYIDKLLEYGIDNYHIPQITDSREKDTSIELEAIINNATNFLASITNYAAISLMPDMKDVILRHFAIFPLNNHDLVLVYIYDNQVVKNKVVKLKRPFNKLQISYVERLLKSRIEDRSLSEISDLLGIYEIKLENGQYILDELIPEIKESIDADAGVKYKIEGTTNLLQYDEFSDANNTRTIIESLKDSQTIIPLLAKNVGEDIEIYIGRENGIEEYKDLSIILGSFKIKGNLTGKLGVIGPVRMEYLKVIRDVSLMCRYISLISN